VKVLMQLGGGCMLSGTKGVKVDIPDLSICNTMILLCPCHNRSPTLCGANNFSIGSHFQMASLVSLCGRL